MAQPTDIYSTYDASASSGVGRRNREDLGNMIWNISPTETPISSALPKTKADAVFHEWLIDSLAATATTGAIDGDDPALTALTPTTRIGNRTQIFTRAFGVTGTQQKVNKAGPKDELAYQQAKKMKEIKRNVEATITDNGAIVAGNDTTARELGGLPAYFTTNTDFGAGGADPAGTPPDGTAARTDGTTRAFTEAQVKTVLQAAFTAGGSPTLLSVGAFNKQVASTFTGNASRTDKSEDKRLVATIDVYESDFGDLKIVPNRFQRVRDAWLLDPEYAAIAVLRPLDAWDLAKTGDSEKKQILTELTLVVRNEAAHAAVFDLTSA